MTGPVPTVARRAALVVIALLLGSACHKSGGPTAPDPVSNLSLDKPGDIRITGVLAPSAVVTFPVPAVHGGVSPATVACSPASGSAFPVGTTTVTCTATDGLRLAETRFSVTIVALVPVLGATRFLAFGDSLTAGELQTNPSIMAVEVDKAYPAVLQGLLRARYLDQTPTVDNQGVPGESAVEGSARIGSAIQQSQPDALLLLQGVLDLGNGGPTAIPSIVAALRTDITIAKSRNVRHIFLSTLLPQKDALPGYTKNNQAMAWIEQANGDIRALAAQQGVYLVDCWAAMVGHVTTLIGGDGLHPTEAGFVAMAEAFMAVIREQLETLPAASSVGLPRGQFLRPPAGASQ